MGKLHALTEQIEVMQDRCQEKSTLRQNAEKTVSSLVDFFEVYPVLADEVDELKKMQRRRRKHKG